MFEGRPLIVTAQLEASQVEFTVLHNRNGSAFFDLTHIHFCVSAWHNEVGDAYGNDVPVQHGFDEIVKDDFATLRQMLQRRR